MRSSFSIVSDIDGVLHRGSKGIPGAARFIRDVQRSGRKYVLLTNSPDNTPRELHFSLRKYGIDVPEANFYTSAQAIVSFLLCHSRRPKVFLIGSRAVRDELKSKGGRFTDQNPEFVVLTSGGSYGRAELDKAIELIMKGAKFITANCEPAGLTETGIKAGCGALIAPIEKATRSLAYVVGKPNHLMIRAAEERFGIVPAETVMIGDCLETDIDVGMQAQMQTVLVLSGITKLEDLDRSPYKPDHVFKNVGEIRLKKLP